ncbi:MAG: type II toxin-antitoxin system VapB family antitoxin [Synergistaceae bacterium]|jgi:antitoxin VapB|nr:type II toxin-antitoxin system VapB family antitoxin [Synergistaceae bacterium]
MKNARVAKVFRNGNSLAVRIPKEFYDGEDLLIQKIGSVIVLSPVKDTWRIFKESLADFSDDFFADGRNQPDMQERESVFHSAE